jgi:hypothetical protein
MRLRLGGQLIGFMWVVMGLSSKVNTSSSGKQALSRNGGRIFESVRDVPVIISKAYATVLSEYNLCSQLFNGYCGRDIWPSSM